MKDFNKSSQLAREWRSIDRLIRLSTQRNYKGTGLEDSTPENLAICILLFLQWNGYTPKMINKTLISVDIDGLILFETSTKGNVPFANGDYYRVRSLRGFFSFYDSNFG